MKALLLHHLGIPCVCQIKPRNEEKTKLNTKFFLNSEALIRIEPGGAVITPPHLYAAFIHVDQDILNDLVNVEVRVFDWPQDTFDLLMANQVIIPEQQNSNLNRNFEVMVPGLPIQALFEVTADCQCDCAQCYHKKDLGKYYPSFSALTKRIDHLKKLGVGLFEITGGEPLLRKDLADILFYIHQAGLHFYVVTNGEYLNNANQKLLTALKMGLGVAISLDGIGSVHDQIRRRSGLYDNILLGLNLLSENNIKAYFISTLHQGNVNLAPAMISLAEKYLTTVHFRPTIDTGAAKDNQLSTDLRFFLQDHLSHPAVRNGLLSTKKLIPEAKYYGCGIRKRISVDAYGNLFPCVMDRDAELKKVEEYDQYSLVQALEDETKNSLLMNSRCQTCELAVGDHVQCGGACRFSKFYNSHKMKSYGKEEI